MMRRLMNEFVNVAEKFHNNIKSKFYVRPKSDAVCFAVHHFAGRVVYQAEGFLEKNRNFLPPEVIQLIRQSQYDMVRFLFQCPITKTGNLYSAVYDTDSKKLSQSNQNTKVLVKFHIFQPIQLSIFIIGEIIYVINFNLFNDDENRNFHSNWKNEKCFHFWFRCKAKSNISPLSSIFNIIDQPYKFFLLLLLSFLGTLLESRSSVSIQSPANCGNLLPILFNGFAAKDGVRIAAVRTMYKTERLEEPAFLRQGESGEAIEIHGGVGDDKDQTEWILA